MFKLKLYINYFAPINILSSCECLCCENGAEATNKILCFTNYQGLLSNSISKNFMQVITCEKLCSPFQFPHKILTLYHPGGMS